MISIRWGKRDGLGRALFPYKACIGHNFHHWGVQCNLISKNKGHNASWHLLLMGRWLVTLFKHPLYLWIGFECPPKIRLNKKESICSSFVFCLSLSVEDNGSVIVSAALWITTSISLARLLSCRGSPHILTSLKPK